LLSPSKEYYDDTIFGLVHMLQVHLKIGAVVMKR